MRLTLRITGDARGEREVTFRKPGDYIIGRVETAHCQVDDGRVSKNHCLLVLKAGEMIVRDLGSVNGTRVDGITLGAKPEGADISEQEGSPSGAALLPQVRREAPIGDGSIIDIGITTIFVSLELEPMDEDKIARWLTQGEQKLTEAIGCFKNILELDPHRAKVKKLITDCESLRSNHFKNS